MADADSDREEEEEEPSERLIKIRDEAHFQSILDTQMQKVVAIAYLIPGNPHCDECASWYRTLSEDPATESAIFLTVDPMATPEFAEKSALYAVPTFLGFWRGEMSFSFVGTNRGKFAAHLARALQQRQQDIGAETKSGRTATPLAVVHRGEKMAIREVQPDVVTVCAGVGWTIEQSDDMPELNLVALVIREDGLLLTDDHVAYYDNPQTPDSGLLHLGDTMGEEQADDDAMEIQLDAQDEFATSIVLSAVVYEGKSRGHSFGQVSNCYIRLYDKETSATIVRYDVELEDLAEDTCCELVRISRHPENDDWEFTAIGTGENLTTEELLDKYKEKENPSPPKRKKKREKT